MISMSESEWAWLAGLFEGEGSINFSSATTVRVYLCMTDLDVVERCLSLTGYGFVNQHSRPNAPSHWKTAWYWQVSKTEHVQEILRGILPWLGERRRNRALEALERASKCHGRNNGICWKGHSITVEKSGHKRCRICATERQREYRARKKAEIYSS